MAQAAQAVEPQAQMELTVRLVEAAVARQPPEVRVEPGTEDVVQDMQALPETAEQAVHVPIPVAAAAAGTMAAVTARKRRRPPLRRRRPPL